MTSKLSWIAFVPFTLAAIAIKVIQLFFMGTDGTFYGLSSLTLSYIAIGCALAVLLFAIIFCIVDRKIAPIYLINKNAFSGIFGILLAVSLACDGANRAFNVVRSAELSFFEIADIVMTVLCAIVFVVMGLNNFVGNGGVRGLAVFYLVPALWSAFRLVKCFLEFTTVSITVTDVTILACYIFVTLFLFNYAMIVSIMKGKSPVKMAYIYGLPAVTVMLSYSCYTLCDAIYFRSLTFNVFNEIESIELALLALYIFAFVVELSINVRRKDEIELVEEDDSALDGAEYSEINSAQAGVANPAIYNNEPEINVEDITADNLSANDDVYIEIAQASVDSTEDYISDVDTSDFVYGAPPSDDDFVLPVDSDTDTTEYEHHAGEDADLYITKEDSTYDDEEETLSVADVVSSMDRIDKLILEISEEDLK